MWIHKSMPDSGPAGKVLKVGRIPSLGSCSPACSLILQLWITKKKKNLKSWHEYKRKKTPCSVGHKVKLALCSLRFRFLFTQHLKVSGESLCVTHKKHSVTLNAGLQSHTDPSALWVMEKGAAPLHQQF